MSEWCLLWTEIYNYLVHKAETLLSARQLNSWYFCKEILLQESHWPFGRTVLSFYFPSFLSIYLADLFQECMGKFSQFKMRKTISCRSRFNFNYKAISNLSRHNRETEFVKLASPWIHNLPVPSSLQDKTLRILLQQTFWLLRKQEILWRRRRQREVRKCNFFCISQRSAKHYVGHKPALHVHHNHSSSCLLWVLQSQWIRNFRKNLHVTVPTCLFFKKTETRRVVLNPLWCSEQNKEVFF